MELAHIHGARLSITVARKAFVTALTLAKRATEKLNTIPILSNVLLRSDGAGRLEILTTDLDVQIHQEMPCEGEQAGAITLDVYTLESTLKKLKGETVRLQDMGGNTVGVTDVETGSTLRLPSLPADDYPIVAAGIMAAEFELDAARFAEIVATVKPAVSTEETRYYLNGIYIHAYCEQPRERTEEQEALLTERDELRDIVRGIVAEEGAEHPAANDEAGQPDESTLEKRRAIRARVTAREAEIAERLDVLEAERCAPDALRYAATDGHRMYVYSTALPEGAAAMPGVIFPRKSCGLIGNIVPKKEAGVAAIAFSEAKFRIRVGHVTITGKLIDGTFPDYTRVIPSQNAGRLTIPDVDSFASAVESVSAVCTEKTRAICISMASERYVTLYASSAENGKSALVCDGPTYKAGHEEIASVPLGMNAAYLRDALAPFAGGDVIVQTEDARCPFLFVSEGRPGLRVVLMPMRFADECFTPDDVARLNMNALETLQSRAPEILAAIERAKAQHADPETPADWRKTLPAFVREQKARLGGMAAEAGAYLRSGKTDKLTSRWQIKSILANAGGDEAARRITGEFLAHLHAGPAGSFKALGEPARPPVRPKPETLPTVLPARPLPPVTKPEPVEAPRPAPQCVAMPEPAPITVQTSPEPLPEPAADEAEREPVKIEDVYGRVYFVDAGDYESDRPFCRRLHKNGAPFTDSEAKGGAWQRILRANIARRILARGSTDRPAKILPAAPVVDSAIADRLAALEEIVARMAAGQPAPALETASESVASEAPAGESEELAALRARVGELEAENAELRADRDHQRRGRSYCASAGFRAVTKLRAELAESVRVRDLAEGEWQAADDDRRRLQVRCDALEAHAAASDRLDRVRPAPVNGHAALVAEPAGAAN